FRSHLVKQGRDGAILLRLSCIIKLGHIDSTLAQHVSQGILQERRQYIECADKVTLEEPREAPAVSVQLFRRDERTVLKQCAKGVAADVVSLGQIPAQCIDLTLCV